MAYQLGGGESTRDGLQRCAREQLESAIDDLGDRVRHDPVEAVHDARKSLKKERAVLRLARGSMPRKQRRRTNAALRDAARRLSVARDADAMIEALETLADRYVGQFPRASVDAIRARLEQEREVARLELMASGAPGEVVEDLKGILTRVDPLPLREGGWSAVGPGVERSYADGRKALARARKKPTTTNLHEWRKRAKDLWYHLTLLQETAPHTVHAHAKDAHLLSDLLGDDHDLAVLRDAIKAMEDELPVDSAAVVAAIDHRREQLQEEAFFLGRRLYAESPKAFTRRLQRYWKGWRAHTRAPRAHSPAQLAEATRTATVH